MQFYWRRIFMRKPKKYPRILYMMMGAIFVISACSAFPSQSTPTEVPAPIEDTVPLVSATGEVVPFQWSTLSMSTAGVVEEILIDEGDQVESGQVLVRLKGKEDIQAAISGAEFEVAAAQKALDDLDEGADTAKTIALENIYVLTKVVRDAQYQLDNFTVPSKQAGMDTLEALEKMLVNLDQARETFEPYKYKSSSDATRKKLKDELEEAQSDYDSAIRRLQYENELEVAKANLDEAKEDYEIWSAGPDPSDVAVAEARLHNANASLAAAQAALDDLELRAAFDGTVGELYIRNGEWVTPGQPILLLADLEHLRVETTDLNEIDAARINVGNSVIVTFDALPDVQVNGVVVSIAPKASAGSGVNYKVLIDLDDIHDRLRWGMTAFVDIEAE
jgi:multidrug efflux pump subunit AcrA (membrane-fusion protein)